MPLQIFNQPIDYSSMLTGADPGAALAQGYQEAELQKLAQAQLQRQLQQRQQLDTARQNAIKNPSGAAFRELFVLDPASREAIKSAHDSLDADTQKQEIGDLTAMYGYAKAGRKEDVRRIAQRRLDADKKAGLDTSDDEQFLGMLDDDDDGQDVLGLISMQLSGRLGPDKFTEAFETFGSEDRAAQELPSKIGLTTAQAAQANATANKAAEEAQQIAPNAEAERKLAEAKVRDLGSQIQWRADSLALDRDKLETTTQVELEKLAQARDLAGANISPGSEAEMTKAVIGAEASRQQANRMSALADNIANANLSGGWVSWLAQNGGQAYGKPNLLRKEYTALVNSQAVKNLPPGPASDRDIKLALQGFPSATANAETMASFLRGMAKLQELGANREQARADWISSNGNLGTAKRDLTVNGVKVPKGSTFGDFSKSRSAVERREAVPERSYMRFGNGGR